MIDFAFLNYLVREVAYPVLQLMKFAARFIGGPVRDLALSAAYLENVGSVIHDIKQTTDQHLACGKDSILIH
jgi:hypothetical protein